MTFNPEIFANEVTLGIIPTDEIPAAAQNAMENGFDGPNVVRMAIIDPKYGYAIDQAIKPMLDELGYIPADKEAAAVRLAQIRAERILANKEDPLESVGYFYKLWFASDYSSELIELGNLDEAFYLKEVMGGHLDEREITLSTIEKFLNQTKYH
jgi:hypothetical protein